MTMNIFRFTGDMSHAASILVLLMQLKIAKNAQGISVRTHELFLVVFLTRYLDLFFQFYSLYNTVMKLLYIASSGYIVYMIHKVEPIASTYDKAHDSAQHWKFIAAPCAVLAFFTNLIGGFNFIEMLWVFSIYLECVAILPQVSRHTLYHGLYHSVT
jgi:ER lumen protein retaining receptor